MQKPERFLSTTGWQDYFATFVILSLFVWMAFANGAFQEGFFLAAAAVICIIEGRKEFKETEKKMSEKRPKPLRPTLLL
ncbi:MAG: hypothetical protein JWL80_609 [Parcubacteria group bacterium]|nr:hypothetical protein [Parcubacteria group bacterium]